MKKRRKKERPIEFIINYFHRNYSIHISQKDVSIWIIRNSRTYEEGDVIIILLFNILNSRIVSSSTTLEVRGVKTYENIFQYNMEKDYSEHCIEVCERIKKELKIKKCSRILLIDYECLKIFLKCPDKTKLYKMRNYDVLMRVRDPSALGEVNFKVCEGFDSKLGIYCSGVCWGKKQRCEICSRARKYLCKKGIKVRTSEDFAMQLDDDDANVLVSSMKKMKLKEVIEIAEDAGALVDGTNVYQTLKEQGVISMVQKKSKNAVRYFKVPHTLQLSLSISKNGYDGIKGMGWVGGTYTGHLFLPHKKTTKRWTKLFGYAPGMNETNITLLEHELKEVEEAYVAMSCDGVNVRRGLTRRMIANTVFWKGLLDYGIKAFLEILSDLKKIKENTTNEKTIRTIRLIENYSNFVVGREKGAMKLASECYWSCLNICARMKGKIVSIHFPLFYFVSERFKQNHAGCLFPLSILYLVKKVKGFEEGKFHFKCFLFDGEKAVISFTQTFGSTTPDLKYDYELRYLIELPLSIDKNLSFCCANDIVHIGKECTRYHLNSTGYVGSKKLLVIIIEKEDNQRLVKFYPVTKRVLDEIYEIENSKSTYMRISRLTYQSLNPDTNEKMKVRLSRNIMNYRTIEAIDHYFLEGKDGKDLRREHNLTVEECLGTKKYVKTITRLWNVFEKKVPATKVDLAIVKESLNFFLKWRDAIMRIPNLRADRNGIPLEGHRKIVRNCRVFIFAYADHAKMNLPFIPHEYFVSNSNEGLFRQQRSQKGGNLSITSVEFEDNIGSIFLEKQDEIKSRIQSRAYEHSETVSNSEKLIDRNIIQKIREEKKMLWNEKSLELQNLRCTSISTPSISDLKSFQNLVMGSTPLKKCYGIRYGYVLAKCSQTFILEGKIHLSKIIDENLVDLIKSNVKTCPTDEMIRVFLVLDVFIRNNMKIHNVIKNISVFEQLLRNSFEMTKNYYEVLKVKSKNEDDKEKVFRSLYNRYVHCRVRDLFRNLGLLPQKGSRTIRARTKKDKVK